MGGGVRTDGYFCLHVQSVSFFPTFIEKQNKTNKKKVAGSSGRIFPKTFI